MTKINIYVVWRWGYTCFTRKTSRNYEIEKTHLQFWRNSSAIHNQADPNLSQKGKNQSISGIIQSTPRWLMQFTKNSICFSFYTNSVYSEATSFSQSVTTKNDNNFPENSSASLELVVVSKTRVCWTTIQREIQLPPTSKGPLRCGMKYFQVWVQKKWTQMDIRCPTWRLSIFTEEPDWNMDAIFRPGKDTSFCPSTFNDFEMGSMAETPILIDEEQDKENSPPPHPTTPVSEIPTPPPVLMTCHPVGNKNW